MMDVLVVPPRLYAGCNMDIFRSKLVTPGRPWASPVGDAIHLHPRDFFLLVVELADVDERTRINAGERLRYLERRWAQRGERAAYPQTIAEAWRRPPEGERR